MEIIQPQDMPKQSPENIRIKKCANHNCAEEIAETRILVANFGTKKIYHWVQSKWKSVDGYCPGCEEKSQAKKREDEAKLKKKRDEQEKQKRKIHLLNSFSNAKFSQEYTFEKFNAMLNFGAYEKAINFNPLSQNLFLYGQTGTGKTHLACSIAREQCEKGFDVEFYTVPNLMREFRRRLDPDKEEQLIHRLSFVPVLVIDDIGVGKATEYVIEKLHEIIDGRQNNYMNGMVLTSNLSLNGIAETFKDRIADRLHGMCELLKMDGDSQRKLKR